MTMSHGDKFQRRSTVDKRVKVTVVSIEPSDTYIVMTFYSFALASAWIHKTICEYERKHKRIRLAASRDWPDGVLGLEILGHYATKDS